MITYSYRIMVSADSRGHAIVSSCRDSYKQGVKINAVLLSSEYVQPWHLWATLRRVHLEVYNAIFEDAGWQKPAVDLDHGTPPPGVGGPTRDGAVQDTLPAI